MIMPVMIIIMGIFILGLFMGLLQSLGYFKAIGLTEITLDYYKEVLRSKDFLSSLGFSLYVSIVSSLIAVVLGIVLAYSIVQRKGKGRLAEVIFKIPISVPHIVAVLLVYNILSQSGILPRLLYALGLIRDSSSFPSLIYDRKGIGIMVTYLWKEIPFVAMVVYTVLDNINERLTEVALNLGASRRQAFFHVILPLILPSAFSAFIIIFAFSFGAYEVPFLLGPTTPKTLPVKAYVEYINPNFANRPYAMVINMIVTFICLGLVWLYFKAFKWISKYTGDFNG